MLGVASENITNGNEGYINLLGAITKLNTSAYTVGTVLYIDPATPGELTSAEPISPKLDMSVAIVTRQHATTGIIFVRMWNQGVDLGEVNDVKITTPADKQVLTYDSSTSVWVNAQPVPAGVISQFAGASAPSGYLLCDGSAVSRTTYSALFAALNTTYGAGNGSTTFNIPNLQNRIPVGKGADVAFDVLGETGGSKTVTLSEANMAAHTHSGSTGNQSADHSHSGSTGTVSADHTHSGSTGTVSAGHTHDGTTGNQSADHTHTGTTGNQSAAHTHAGPSHQHTITVIDSRTSLQRGTGTTGTNTPDAPVTSKGTSFSGTQNTGTASSNHTHDITTGGVSANHTHSFTSGGQSANHIHSFSTGGISANHTHSFSTAVQSANNTHSFTTNSGTGTATPVNTLPPYIVVNYIIKT
jgi:microcystin-dependent protein